MLKIITIITKFILVTLTALLFASCNQSINLNSIKGSGNVTIENRRIDGTFKSVEVSNDIDLVIEQGDNTAISVEADDNLQKHITTRVENGVLIVACDYNSFFNIESKKVIVKTPIIEELSASSAATINSVNTLRSENISFRTSSAATINVNVKSDNIHSKSSSGSSITLEGMALNLEALASSGSSINAGSLLVNDIIAKSSSGSTIRVHPIVNLNANATSGSNISYKNQPQTIRKMVHSGGSVDKQ